MLERYDVVRDPIYGYIELTKIEKRLLDTYPLQRLRRLYSTPCASYVYPGATATRFSHSLGVKHLAGSIAEELANKHNWPDDIIQNVRIAGLLHDIGHGPFSHTFDAFLGDSGIRLNHELIGCYILNLHDDLTTIIPNESQRAEIAFIAWGEKNLRKIRDMKSKIQDVKERVKNIRLLSGIIHGPPHCADILDYVVRDSHYSGVEYGLIDVKRLIMFMDEFRGKLGIENRAFEAYESMVLARYNMYRAVYLHRASRAMDIVLLNAIKAVDAYLRKKKGGGLTEITKKIPDEKEIKEYMRLDDSLIFTTCNEICNDNDRSNGFQTLAARRLLTRRIPKMAYRRPENELERASGIIGVNMEDAQKIWKKKIITRLRKKGFDVDDEDGIIDVPSLATIPYHGYPGRPRDIAFFETEGTGKKRRWPIPIFSLLRKLEPKREEIRVYSYKNEIMDGTLKICRTAIWKIRLKELPTHY